MDHGKREKRVTKRNEVSKNQINLNKNTIRENVKSEGKGVT